MLVVDDEADIRELLDLTLARIGLSADCAGTVAEARKFLERERYGLCLTDMRLPDGEGLDIVRLIAATGLRRANVLKMEWAWFDAERGMLTVPPASDKGGKGFSIRLADSVVDYLVERKQHATGRYVFSNPRTGRPYHSRFSAWDSVRKRAGLPMVRIHDLRHSYASLMLESGSDIVDVQAALGHTQLKTTAVYLHLREGRKRERANAAVAAAGLF